MDSCFCIESLSYFLIEYDPYCLQDPEVEKRRSKVTRKKNKNGPNDC